MLGLLHPPIAQLNLRQREQGHIVLPIARQRQFGMPSRVVRPAHSHKNMRKAPMRDGVVGR